MKLYDNDAYRDEFMELVYSLLHSDGTNDRANQIIDAFDSAMAVEAEPILPNDPLTLEELRKMDGEPYWHVGLQEDSAPPHWSILDPFFAKHIENYGYGERWLAYRRRPENQKDFGGET